MSFDRSILTIHRNTRKITDMLVRSGKLVKQCRFSTILIADKSIGEQCPLRQRILILLRMIFSFLTKSRMCDRLQTFFSSMTSCSLVNWRNLDLIRFCQPECQFVSVNLQLHGISHRCQFHYRHLCPGNHPHVQKVLSQRTLSSHRADHGTLPDFQFF